MPPSPAVPAPAPALPADYVATHATMLLRLDRAGRAAESLEDAYRRAIRPFPPSEALDAAVARWTAARDAALEVSVLLWTQAAALDNPPELASAAALLGALARLVTHVTLLGF